VPSARVRSDVCAHGIAHEQGKPGKHLQPGSANISGFVYAGGTAKTLLSRNFVPSMVKRRDRVLAAGRLVLARRSPATFTLFLPGETVQEQQPGGEAANCRAHQEFAGWYRRRFAGLPAGVLTLKRSHVCLSLS
jgi:hypothetical protein